MSCGTYDEFLDWYKESEAFIEKLWGNGASDMRWLAEKVYKKAEVPSEASFLKQGNQGWDELEVLVGRRKKGEPVAYILGEWEFYGLPMKVAPGVLIPRPETELLVDLIKRDFASHKNLLAVDLGSGSGCIAIAIANELSMNSVKAVEKSLVAFEILCENTKLNRAEKMVTPVHARAEDLTEVVDAGTLDFIVANPPYIDKGDTAVMENVRRHEPAEALFAGENGMEDIKLWLELAYIALKPKGRYYFEIGYRQEDLVRAHVLSFPQWNLIEVVKDLSGNPRVVVCEKLR